MIEIILYLFFFLLGFGTLLAGIILLIYGLYSMSIPGFDPFIRRFSLITGTLLISVVLSVYFYIS
ncbi:MAG: hypothetical protein WDZ35_10945 [Crocinitomicaceae bacterium]